MQRNARNLDMYIRTVPLSGILLSWKQTLGSRLCTITAAQHLPANQSRLLAALLGPGQRQPRAIATE